MTSPFDPSLLLSRRGILNATAGVAAASAVAASAVVAQTADSPRDAVTPAPRYPFRKSLNLWAMPYPSKMTLEQCLRLAKEAGFEGVELNYDLESDLSPKHGTAHFQEIRRMADRIGIAISGLCSFLFWPYPLTSNDPAKRQRGFELAGGPITSRCPTMSASRGPKTPSAG
jgi:L-ribulose-5-phosphate 3-epimerase